MPISDNEIDKLKHASTVSGVPHLILQRWSPRAYADKTISSQDLTALFEAARWAASSSNEQPWRFLVGRRGDETYRKILEALVEFNQAWAKSAPVLILSLARKTFSQNNNPNYHALYDTGAATANLSLAATALGLHTHSMAGFDQEKARKLFDVPDEYHIGAVTAVGYFGDADQLSSQLKERELAPRARKPLAEFVFSEIDKPASL